MPNIVQPLSAALSGGLEGARVSMDLKRQFDESAQRGLNMQQQKYIYDKMIEADAADGRIREFVKQQAVEKYPELAGSFSDDEALPDIMSKIKTHADEAAKREIEEKNKKFIETTRGISGESQEDFYGQATSTPEYTEAMVSDPTTTTKALETKAKSAQKQSDIDNAKYKREMAQNAAINAASRRLLAKHGTEKASDPFFILTELSNDYPDQIKKNIDAGNREGAEQAAYDFLATKELLANPSEITGQPKETVFAKLADIRNRISKDKSSARKLLTAQEVYEERTSGLKGMLFEDKENVLQDVATAAGVDVNDLRKIVGLTPTPAKPKQEKVITPAAILNDSW